MAVTVITIQSPDATKYDPLSTDRFPANDKSKFINQLCSSIRRVVTGQATAVSAAGTGGEKRASVTVASGGVEARGFITVGAAVSTNTAQVNTLTFTAVAVGTAPSNVQFVAMTSDPTVTAKNLADAINASANALIVGLIRAHAVGAVVYLYAINPGTAANSYGIVCSANLTASAATFAGGSAPTLTTIVPAA